MDDKDFLSYFEDLKNAEQAQLLLIIEKIIQTLVVFDRTSSASGQQKFQSAFGKNINEGIDYAVKRLVKGMMSTTPSIQLNYCLAFQQILKKFQTIEISTLLDFVVDQSDKKQAINKQEIYHFKIGRLYCFKAFAESGYADQLKGGILTRYYDILFSNLAEDQWCLQNIIEIIRLSLKTNLKEKLKVIINNGKDLLKQHNFNSIHFLAMLYFVCKENKIQFNLENYLNEKIFNHKNFLIVLKEEVKNFPRQNVGMKYIIMYIKDVCEHSERKSEIWQEFWQFLVQNFSLDFKHIYLILCFMKNYLKNFELPDIKHIFNEDIIHMWLKNLNVKNKSMAEASQKIEKRLLNKLQDKAFEERTPEEKQIITELFTIIRSRTTYRFTPKKSLAKLFFGMMGEQEMSDFYKNTKKKIGQIMNPVDFSFYISDIYVLADLNFQKISEAQIIEVCFYLFQAGTEFKLQQTYDKFPDDVKEETGQKSFIASNQTQIFNYFSSIICSIIKQAQPINSKQQDQESQQNSKPKQPKWFNKDNESLIWKIIQNILQKVDTFQADKRIYQTIMQIQKSQQFISSLYTEIQSDCKQGTTNKEVESGLSKNQKVAFFNLVCSTILFNLIGQDDNQQPLQEDLEEQEQEGSVEQQLLELKEIYGKLKEQYSLQEQIQKKRKTSTQSNTSKNQQQGQTMKGSHVLIDLMISMLTKSPVFLREAINYCMSQFIDSIDSVCVSNILEVISRPMKEYIKDMIEQEEQKDEIDQELDEENIELEESDLKEFQTQIEKVYNKGSKEDEEEEEEEEKEEEEEEEEEEADEEKEDDEEKDDEQSEKQDEQEKESGNKSNQEDESMIIEEVENEEGAQEKKQAKQSQSIKQQKNDENAQNKKKKSSSNFEIDPNYQMQKQSEESEGQQAKRKIEKQKLQENKKSNFRKQKNQKINMPFKTKVQNNKQNKSNSKN